ncbi:MAG: hypothetical protein HYT87_19620 [Nitrospirae bacterium]|nr:hypothetical protein [Nitrospirota bacterium]
MNQSRWRILDLVALWGLTILVIFGGYELAERFWLGALEPGLIRRLHIARGIGASALTAILVGIYLARRQPPSMILGGGAAYLPKPEIELVRDQAAWFVRMRWFAAGLAALGCVIATRLISLLPAENLVPLLTCVLGLMAANAIFTFRVSRTDKPYRLIVIQAAVDLLILTYLLHFSGGIENPFYLVYLPHVIIAGIILSRRDAFFVTLLTCLLFLSLAVLEYTDVWHHSFIGLSPHGNDHDEHGASRLVFVVGESIPFLLVTLFTAYFTILLRDQIHRDQANVLQASKLATIGELAGRLAHEVNNPIGIISTNAKLLLENKSLPKDAVPLIEKIDRHSERIAALTRGLLSFSRPSPGQRTSVDLNRIVRDSLRLVEPEAAGAGIRIEKKLADPLPPIHANGNDLQHVILNLASNAVAAMPRGGTLRLETGHDGNGWVSLALADTGTGIPARIVDHIFDPFFTTKPEDKGTGLGLSIVQGIVRSHGGIIDVWTREGKGTTFTVRLPILKNERGSA